MSISDTPTEAQIKTTLRALDIAAINGIRYPLFDDAAKVIRWLQVCVSGANHDAEARRVAIEALTEGRGLDDEGLWAMLKEERDAAKARVAELERQLSMLDPAPLVNSLRAEIDEAMSAVNECLKTSNGRESEWGERATVAIGFLHELCIKRQERRGGSTMTASNKALKAWEAAFDRADGVRKTLQENGLNMPSPEDMRADAHPDEAAAQHEASVDAERPTTA